MTDQPGSGQPLPDPAGPVGQPTSRGRHAKPEPDEPEPYPYAPDEQEPPGPPGAGPRRSRKWWWIGAAAVVVVVLVAAGVTAVLLNPGARGGAISPQAAVLEFLTAAENVDAFAAADLLDPAEQAGIRQVLESAHDTAEESTFQQGGGPNGALQGFRIATDNVHAFVTTIRDDLARVTMTDGQITLTFDPANANPGIREAIEGKEPMERTWTVSDLTVESESGQPVFPALMTVRRSGKWYVSLIYSYLDTAARDAGKEPVDPGAVDIRRYDSPEAAARGFVDGLVSTLATGDIMPVAKTLARDNAMLLATYRPLFNELRQHSLQIVGTPEFSATTTDDTAEVRISDLVVEHRNDAGELERVRFHGDCITADLETTCEGRGWDPLTVWLFNPRKSGVIAARDDTGWHIDPVATYLNSLAEAVRDAQQDIVALLIAETFDAPAALLRLTGAKTLQEYGSTIVTLQDSALEGLGIAVLDLPVRAGERVTVSTDSGSRANESWRVVGESGELAKSYSGEPSVVVAVQDETLKMLIWGIAGESVIVSVAP